uniref:LSM domain-containing protein n=1 Tax=viral metagenome TaxID=1070528 RepID=A0A6M3M2V0_9ZZZZ
MTDIKKGPPPDKIMNYLGTRMEVELKNHHKIVGTLAFYHLQEQTIHLTDWMDVDEKGQITKSGSFIIINRTAWFQLYNM